MAAAKPKIDLKARLGRKSSAPTAASAPAASPPGVAAPPAAAVAPTPPAAAPAGFGPSIPPPPGFGPKPTPAAAAPRVAPVAAAPVARPQEIKIEMGEEVVEARRRGRSKVLILAAICAGIGLALGFGVGKMAEAAAGAETAVVGAESLVKEIDDNNIKLNELLEILKKAREKVVSDKYPSEEIEALGALEIPFTGTTLLNKGIGRFNANAVTMLMQYANASQNATDKKDKLRRLFSAVKPQFEAAAAEKEAPMVKWAVSVMSGPKGPWAKVKLVKPFAVNDKKKKGYRWPKQLEHAKGKKTRYAKGEPQSDEMVPVDPVSQGQVCNVTVKLKLGAALADLAQELKGVDTPGAEKLGVIDLGDKTMDQLRRIGGSR